MSSRGFHLQVCLLQESRVDHEMLTPLLPLTSVIVTTSQYSVSKPLGHFFFNYFLSTMSVSFLWRTSTTATSDLEQPACIPVVRVADDLGEETE